MIWEQGLACPRSGIIDRVVTEGLIDHSFLEVRLIIKFKYFWAKRGVQSSPLGPSKLHVNIPKKIPNEITEHNF